MALSAVVKTREIVSELMVSLDFEEGGDIAKNLFSLYTWFNQELLEGNIKQDTNRIRTVRNMINDLRSAWHTIAAQNMPEKAGKMTHGINIAG